MINIDEYVKNFFKLPKVPEDWIRVRDEMIVHTRGVKPVKLLETKRPGEPKELLDYRVANWRPITKDGINSSEDSIYRIITGSNYELRPSEKISEYIFERKFTFQDETSPDKSEFETLFFRDIFRLGIDDANGLLVWMPVNSTDKDLPPHENPENKTIEVEPMIVDCDRIKDLREDVVSFEAKQSLPVEIPDGSKKTTKFHKYYFVITKESIWRIIPFWNKDNRKVDYKSEFWFNLSLDKDGNLSELRTFSGLPVRILGGNTVLNKDRVKYRESFLYSYVPFGDECICAFSDNTAVRVRYNFPFVSVKGQKCYTCNGVGKVDKDGKKVKCTTCNGLKTIPTMSPFSQFIKEPPTASENEAFALSPVVEFAHAEVGILKHSFEVWQLFLDLAKEAISVKFIKEAQSGVAKEIDRERKYELLASISHNLFELMKWSMDIIQDYREPFTDDRKENQIKFPTSFNIKTIDVLQEELKQAQTTSQPAPFLVQTARKLGERIFNTDEVDQKILDFLTIYDPLFGKSEQQISQLKAAGIDQKYVIANVHGYTILKQISIEEKGFIEISFAEIKKKFDEKLPVEKEEFDLIGDGGVGPNSLGKIPLAMQQLGLAVQRANDNGNTALAKRIQAKMDELLETI